MSGFTIKGITDEATTCDCCGRRGLKRVVVLMPLDADGNEDVEVTYYGTTCAAKALRRTTTWVANQARAAQLDWEAKAQVARNLLAAYEPVENAPVREKFRVFALERNNQLRPGETVTSAVAGLLAYARAVLAARV
uniref:Uncharacterized protein n=1 Tax=Streptomyces sp. FR1 TaxID=349971 RepID=V9YZM1_9ACTN|nr:hypothetical protein [Streptomyces sp. FR1]AHE38780.1 Hypothetical protein pFRL3_3c [Streptomyces sp. FR1]